MLFDYGTAPVLFFGGAVWVLSVNRFYLATAQAVVPRLVPHEDLLMANSMATVGGTVALLLGVFVGGWIADLVDPDTLVIAISLLLWASFARVMALPRVAARSSASGRRHKSTSRGKSSAARGCQAASVEDVGDAVNATIQGVVPATPVTVIADANDDAVPPSLSRATAVIRYGGANTIFLHGFED